MDERSRLLAKIKQHIFITDLLSKRQTKCDELRNELAKNEKELTAFASKRDELLNQLITVGSMSPASYEVQQYLHQAEQTSSSQTSSTLMQPVTEYEPQSLVAMIVEAAKNAEQLECYNEMLEDMYVEAIAKITAISAELNDMKIKETQMEEVIQKLKRNVEELERQLAHSNELNIESQQRRQLGWSFSSSSGSQDSDNASMDLTSDDPVRLREKIRELNERVATLMNHNYKWNTICENMRKEIEEAKCELEETCRTSSAGHESQQEGKSHLSLAGWTSRIRLHVEVLESKIVELEKSLETKDFRDVDIEKIQMVDHDFILAMKYQLEENNTELKERDLALSREKSNMKSLQLQIDTLHKQLDAAFKEKEEVAKQNKKKQETLKEVCEDKTLLEKYLNRSPSPCAVEASSGSMHGGQKKSTTSAPRRLEEDGK